jgi:peptidoglycan/LPS O-acetylase OafA/YrhL
MLRSRKIKLSLISSVLSLVALTLLIGLTSPIDNVSYALAFFAAAFWFLVSLGHLLIYVRRGKLGPKSRGRIVIFSVFLVLVMMFSSSQSLNWVDGLILLLVLAGLLFYSSRRDKRR